MRAFRVLCVPCAKSRLAISSAAGNAGTAKQEPICFLPLDLLSPVPRTRRAASRAGHDMRIDLRGLPRRRLCLTRSNEENLSCRNADTALLLDEFPITTVLGKKTSLHRISSGVACSDLARPGEARKGQTADFDFRVHHRRLARNWQERRSNDLTWKRLPSKSAT